MIKKRSADRLSRESGTNVIYNGLLERKGSLCKENKKYARDIFKLAMAFGYDNNVRLKIETKENFINKINFGDTLLSLINALAITKSSKGITVLEESHNKIYNVAEEYANGGLELLNSEYSRQGDAFVELLRLRILDLNKDDEIIKKLNQLDL